MRQQFVRSDIKQTVSVITFAFFLAAEIRVTGPVLRGIARIILESFDHIAAVTAEVPK